MKRWRVEVIIAAMVAVGVAIGLAYSLTGDDANGADVVESAPEDSIIFRIDLESAFKDAELVEVSERWREVAISPEDVVAGDPHYVLASQTDEDQKNLRVLFRGYWPMSDDYPIVINDGGMPVRSSSGATRQGPAALRVSFAGDIDSVGTVTFILGECAGASYLETIKAICDAREGTKATPNRNEDIRR